jgi:hypothetical protein
MAAGIVRSEERYWWPGHVYGAVMIYILSLVLWSGIPFAGLLAFVIALEMIVRCIMSPATALAGDWLIGLSWLANPAAWAGMVFLQTGERRRAAFCGEIALLLAACAQRPIMFCQYVWLASMVYVLFVGLCVPGDNATPAKRLVPKLRPIFYPAIALPVLFGLLLVLVGQRYQFEISEMGGVATRRILRRASS